MATALTELKLERFLRQVEPAMMRTYVSSRRSLLSAESYDADWFASLDPEQRTLVWNELERVSHLCTHQGRDTLIELFMERGLKICLMGDHPAESLDGIYDVALFAFVLHQQVFEDGYFLLECKRLTGRVRFRGRPGPPVDDPEKIAEALQTHLEREHEKRYPGGRCLVDVRSDPETLTLLVNYETRKQATEVFKSGERKIIVMRHRPVRRELAVYYPESGILDLKANAGRRDALRVGVGECLFLEAERFDARVEVDLGAILSFRARLQAIAEADLEQVTAARLVRIAGHLRDGHGTVFSVASDDVFESLEDGIILHDGPTVTEATLAFDYRSDAKRPREKTAKVRLIAKSHQVKKPEARGWPAEEIMPLLEKWGLVKMPPAPS